jgi:hypothetical protein
MVLGLIIIIIWGFIFLIIVAVYDTMTRSAEPHWRTVRIAYMLISIVFVIFGILFHKRLLIRFHKRQFIKLAAKLDGDFYEHLFKLILTSQDVEIRMDFYSFYIELKNIDSPPIRALRIWKKWDIQISDLPDEQQELYKKHLIENLIRLKRTGYDIWKILTITNNNKRIEFYNYEMKAESMFNFIRDMKQILETKLS